jgi:hypothetical protein
MKALPIHEGSPNTRQYSNIRSMITGDDIYDMIYCLWFKTQLFKNHKIIQDSGTYILSTQPSLTRHPLHLLAQSLPWILLCTSGTPDSCYAIKKKRTCQLAAHLVPIVLTHTLPHHPDENMSHSLKPSINNLSKCLLISCLLSYSLKCLEIH